MKFNYMRYRMADDGTWVDRNDATEQIYKIHTLLLNIEFLMKKYLHKDKDANLNAESTLSMISILMEGANGDMHPIPMILHCPNCGIKHVDEPNPSSGWSNPPHHKHLCLECGSVWEPCKLNTEGVVRI